jgi:UDP-N-acetylglucosamine--N-acetylmuramyl-(pentapeptide) pyrophosphoryl-undecaprenol N-acetylglucosamine transferase
MAVFVLMAGGTGGHLFPAMALAEELRRRGHHIHLMTDHRVESYGGDFPAQEIHVVPSATPSLKNPVKFVLGGFRILWGIGVAWVKLGQIRPDAVVGFGGYPVFPPFLAAFLRGIPGLLHEQNAVMGRANRALARFAKVIATSFADIRFAEPYKDKIILTGNPVRDRVRELAAEITYTPPRENGPLRLLVFGGSQGARAFSDLVPPAIVHLPEPLRKRLEIVQQCRPEDLERVATTYGVLKINVTLEGFFSDLPERMIGSHLVICRSGASSVTEIGVLGVPAIFIPLPGSIDADQKANAATFEREGAGWLVEQANISPQSLANRLEELFNAPDRLRAAALAAKAQGRPEAVVKLADLAETIAAARRDTDSGGISK